MLSPLEDKQDFSTLLTDAPKTPEGWAERFTWEGEFAHELYTRNAPYLASLSFQFFAWYYLRRHLEHDIADYQVELYRLLEQMRAGQNALFLLPRGHGKSTIISFAYVLWHICYRTKRHVGIVSSTSDLAQKFLAKIGNELRNNELIRRDFGDLSGMDSVGKKEVWRQAKLRTANQVVVFAIGTGGSIRGINESLPDDIAKDYVGRDRHGRAQFRTTKSFRPDLLVFDDIVEMKWLKSRKVRDWVEDWLLTSALPAIDTQRGNIIVVGTTLHGDDLVSRLHRDRVRTQAWLKIRHPACDGFDKHCNPINPLWPSFWSLPDTNKPLDAKGRLLPWEEAQYRIKYQSGEGVYYLSHIWWKKVELGSKAFAQEYLLDPMADGLKLFDRAWVRYYVTRYANVTSEQEQAIINAGIRLDVLPEDLVAVTTVDPASARGQQAADNNSDYSVVSTVGYSPSMRRFYLLDIDRVRTTPAVLMQILLRHYRVYNRQFGGVMKGHDGQEIHGHECEHLGIVVETVGYQKALAISLDELANALGMYPLVIEVKRGRSDKKVRATSASPLVENGQMYWPCLLVGNLKPDYEQALDELDRFPEAEHDDCFPPETLIWTDRGEVPICEVTTRDRVWTRGGWRRVLKSWCTGTKEVITNFGITATPNHPVWTENRGWVALADLRVNDSIQTCPTKSAERQSSGMVDGTIGTPYRSAGICGSITGAIHATTKHLKRCTETFGASVRALFRMATKCTTRTAIRSIMPLRILSVCPPPSTVASTPRNPGNADGSLSNWNTLPSCAPSARKPCLNAQFAGQRTRHTATDVTGFVQQAAATRSTFRPLGRKKSAGGPEKPTQNARLSETWNLHIEEHHEFVANGVLVHNCVDSLVDALNFLNRMSLSLNRGLAARVAMREMIRQSPELYAYVAEKESHGDDMQDAINQYRDRN